MPTYTFIMCSRKYRSLGEREPGAKRNEVKGFENRHRTWLVLCGVMFVENNKDTGSECSASFSSLFSVCVISAYL